MPTGFLHFKHNIEKKNVYINYLNYHGGHYLGNSSSKNSIILVIFIFTEYFAMFAPK